MPSAPPELVARLHQHGQSHLLAGWDDLTDAGRASLAGQLAGLDFAQLDALFERRNDAHAALPGPDRLAPITVEDTASISPTATARGDAALKAGEVAVLVVAGGQGTRLGSDQPKGLFPVGPVSGASLFQWHAEKVLALSRRAGRVVPFLVMTSPATHADTVAFFAANADFGLAPGQVRFFQQGTMPAADLATGKLLLEAPGKLFTSPNGHGGTLTALADSGLLASLQADGVRHVFYFQVDNPLVKIADPAFVGRHIDTGSEVSTKVVFKTDPGEKVGVLALVDGRCAIVEYSDLPAELAAARDAAGALRYPAGNTAIHVFSVPFLERVTGGTTRLAYHVARKKVPHFDPETGRPVTPDRENAVKYELFVFDALPLADRWLVVRADRADEFAPLKNATGADCPATVRQALIDQATRWLTAAGAAVPAGVPVEVRPLAALNAADLVGSPAVRGLKITGPTQVG